MKFTKSDSMPVLPKFLDNVLMLAMDAAASEGQPNTNSLPASSDSEISQKELLKQAGDEKTRLFEAVQAGDVDSLRRNIDGCGSEEAFDIEQAPPLYRKAAFFSVPEEAQKKERYLQDLKWSDPAGRTALHISAANGNAFFIEDVNVCLGDDIAIIAAIGDKSRMTPLHIATEHEHDFCVDMLLKINPEGLSYKDAWGRTPFFIAVERGNVKYTNLFILYVNMKIDVGLNERVRYPKLPLSGLAIDGRAPIFTLKDQEGQTLLDRAVESGDLEMTTLLLQTGIIVQQLTEDQQFKLVELASQFDDEVIMHAVYDSAIFAELTPLFLAYINGDKEIFDLLINKKADEHLGTFDGLSLSQYRDLERVELESSPSSQLCM